MENDENKFLGRIYQIYCNETGERYIGSTKQKLSQRIQQHKHAYKCYITKKSERYILSFKIIERRNFGISLLETRYFDSKEEMEQRERWFIENLPNIVNKVIPCRTQEEYYNDNRFIILEKKKTYYELNKDKKRQYYLDNKERILENQKKYYYGVVKPRCEDFSLQNLTTNVIISEDVSNNL